MSPLRARLTLFAISTLFAITATNALFLQGPLRTGEPTSSISLSEVTQKDSPPVVLRKSSALSETAITSPPASTQPERKAKVEAAIERQLTRKGYEIAQGGSVRGAVIAYEFDAGLPLSGAFSDGLLKQMVFETRSAPRGPLADRAEADRQLVLSVQKKLLELGFFSGTLTSQMDIWTINAVKAFERHRGIGITGRLNEATLGELIAYSGQPVERAAR